MPMANSGRAKLTEECGELLQVLGKIEAMHGNIDKLYFDGGGLLRRRLEDEIADVLAACGFVMETHELDAEYIMQRIDVKRTLYEKWT